MVDRAPEVAAKGARVFPPQARDDLRTTADGITCLRTREFVIVPETSGAVEVPPPRSRGSTPRPAGS